MHRAPQGSQTRWTEEQIPDKQLKRWTEPLQQMDRHTTGSLPIQTNDSQGKVKSLYWLSLRLDQQQPQAQGGSDRGPLDSQWGWLQQWPWVSGGYASSSTAPHAGRCPGGSMMGVNEPWPGAQQPLLGSLPGWGAHSHTLAWPQFSQPCLPIGPALLPGGEPMCASVGAGGAPHLLEPLAGKCLELGSPLGQVLLRLLSLILE